MNCCAGYPSCTLVASAWILRENVCLVVCDHCITELVAAGKINPSEPKPFKSKNVDKKPTPPRSLRAS